MKPIYKNTPENEEIFAKIKHMRDHPPKASTMREMLEFETAVLELESKLEVDERKTRIFREVVYEINLFKRYISDVNLEKASDEEMDMMIAFLDAGKRDVVKNVLLSTFN